MHCTSRIISFAQHRRDHFSLASFHLIRGLALAGTAALCSLAAAASAQGCPNLRGHWVSGSGGGLSMDLEESDCKLLSNNLDSATGYHHTLRGQWEPDQYSFSLTVARLDPRNCWTHLYGRISIVNASTFNFDITSTEGRCGLPANFTDHGTYTRH